MYGRIRDKVAGYEDWPEELQHVWEETTGAGNWLTPSEMEDFRIAAMEFFETGWIESEIESEARQSAREEFFSLMEEYDLDIALFDWDDWRDWYESV